MQTETILVVGKKGSGKTTWAHRFVQDKTRVIVADAGFGEFGFHIAREFTDLVEAIRRGFFRVSFTPLYDDWPFLLRAAMAAGREGGPLWLVLEEASRLPDPRACEEYERLLIMGRHFGVNLLAISTRPAHLPIDYRSQATRVIAFRQHERRDVEYLENIIGDDAERLPGLGKFKFLEWRDDHDAIQNEGTDGDEGGSVGTGEDDRPDDGANG